MLNNNISRVIVYKLTINTIADNITRINEEIDNTLWFIEKFYHHILKDSISIRLIDESSLFIPFHGFDLDLFLKFCGPTIIPTTLLILIICPVTLFMDNYDLGVFHAVQRSG